MKRILALILCCVMLLPVATGCKDKNLNKTIDLNDKRIAADLLEQYESKFTYTYAEGQYTLTDMKITSNIDEGNSVKLALTATVQNEYVSVNFVSAMEYKKENNYWRLHRMGFNNVVATPIAAPNRKAILGMLSTYVRSNGNALAKKGIEYYNLMFDMQAVTWGISFDKVTKTSQFLASFKNANLAFTGYYDLSFGENGWVINSVTQEGKSHPVLYLQTLDMKK